MQFNVSSLLKEHIGATREFDIDDDVVLDGARRHVAGHVRMDRTKDGILVRARMRGDMEAECSRCLRPVAFPVDVEFEEEYLPTVDLLTGAHVHPPQGEEDAYRINERHILSLEEPTQQYWTLALPMAPLCRDDCEGLCTVCGADLATAHDCVGEQVDSRWAKLEELRLGRG